jgi:DNA-binding NarL/FixJ family response regulator
MKYIGVQHDMLVTTYDSLDEVELPVLLESDVVALDYQLGTTTGVEMTKALRERNVKRPTLLISATQAAFDGTVWPDNIRGFASKELGPFGLLDAVRQVAREGVEAEAPSR